MFRVVFCVAGLVILPVAFQAAPFREGRMLAPSRISISLPDGQPFLTVVHHAGHCQDVRIVL